jgi:MFS family permease
LPLTCNLHVSSGGVLLGGKLADRTHRHGWVVALSSLTIAFAAAAIALLNLGLPALVALFIIAGLAAGMIAPSRDMLVRAVTPPGASGRVFGFVMTGFNIGSLLLPPTYGYLLDVGQPRLVFWAVAFFALLTLVTIMGASGGHARPQPVSGD